MGEGDAAVSMAAPPSAVRTGGVPPPPGPTVSPGAQDQYPPAKIGILTNLTEKA